MKGELNQMIKLFIENLTHTHYVMIQGYKINLVVIYFGIPLS